MSSLTALAHSALDMSYESQKDRDKNILVLKSIGELLFKNGEYELSQKLLTEAFRRSRKTDMESLVLLIRVLAVVDIEEAKSLVSTLDTLHVVDIEDVEHLIKGRKTIAKKTRMGNRN